MKQIFTLIAILSVSLAGAQDIHFSQFYENAILRNPALTGVFSGDYKIGVNYRSQWGSIANPFQTVIASAETRVMVNRSPADYLSFGLCTSYDRAGSIDFNSLQIVPAVNYNKNLNDRHASYLSLGFAAGYIQRSINQAKMTLDEQYINGDYVQNAPTSEAMSYTTVRHYDVSAGMSFNSSFGDRGQVVYYIGAAAWHITRPKEAFNPNENFVRLNAKYTGNIGIRARLSPHLGVSVLGNYTSQFPFQETIFGGLLNWRGAYTDGHRFALHAGCFVRLQDAVIPTVKIEYNTYSFTASYDVTTSSLKPVLSAKGGWEFSVYARGRYRKTDNVVDRVNCPKFEDYLLSEFDRED